MQLAKLRKKLRLNHIKLKYAFNKKTEPSFGQWLSLRSRRWRWSASGHQTSLLRGREDSERGNENSKMALQLLVDEAQLQKKTASVEWHHSKLLLLEREQAAAQERVADTCSQLAEQGRSALQKWTEVKKASRIGLQIGQSDGFNLLEQVIGFLMGTVTWFWLRETSKRTNESAGRMTGPKNAKMHPREREAWR